MRRYFMICGLLSAVVCGAQTRADSIMPLVEKGDPVSADKIAERMKALKVNGMALAVVDQGQLAWAKGYGIKDASDPAGLVDTATLFQCASIGKLITAVAVMQLVKENKINLDEDVNNKLVSWKIPGNEFTERRKVSLRMLLSHSAGFTDYYGFEGYYPGTAPLPTLVQMLNAEAPANNRKKLVVRKLPGSEEHYSGGGFLLIQQLIEDLSGQSFAAYVQDKVFSPFGMFHSTYAFYPDSEKRETIARGHEDNGKVDPKRKYNIYPELAAAGPWTTATDLARLIVGLQSIRNGQIVPGLDTALLNEMLTPQINSMGLGFHLKGAEKVYGYWHSGNNAGFTGVIFGVTATGQGAVVLTNSNAGEGLMMEVIRSIAAVYRWPVMQALRPVEIANPGKYAGEYLLNEKDGLEVLYDKHELHFRKKGTKPAFRLFLLPDGSFRIAEKPDNLSFRFKEDSSGKVTEMIMYENGNKEYHLKRAD